MTFKRITVDPAQMGGVPCLRGLRISVATVVSMTADGMTQEDILRAYPDLTPEDIREALQYTSMNNKMFDDLFASVREGGAILQSKTEAARQTVINDPNITSSRLVLDELCDAIPIDSRGQRLNRDELHDRR